MKRRNFLAGLVSCITALSIPDLSSYLHALEPTRSPTQNNLDNRLIDAFSRGNAREILYRTLEDYIYHYYQGDNTEEGYVDFISKYCSEVKRNVKIIGKEEVIEKYVEVQRKCLVLALTSAFKEVSDEDIDKLSDELVSHQKENAKETYIDYEHHSIKKGYESFSREKVEFFKKIIEKNFNNPQKDFKVLFRNTFSRKEYIQELEKQKRARKDLYGSFAESLKSYNGFWAFLVRLFGPGIVQKTREKSDEYNLREIDKIYGSEKE